MEHDHVLFIIMREQPIIKIIATYWYNLLTLVLILQILFF